jgi:hypothetical protein
LLEIVSESGKAVGMLIKMSSPNLTPNEITKLTSLRNEVDGLNVNIEYGKNINQAIAEYELGHHLASALISSRVIIYCLDHISGKNDEDKIKHLVDTGKITGKRTDLKKLLVKASKEARNFYSHDIKVFASNAEALSLLGDSVKIVHLISTLEKH